MASVQDASARASNDEAASARLWSDPAAFGSEVGLRGAALAELIGSVRSATKSRDEGTEAMALIFASVNVEIGRGGWPFVEASHGDWPQFVALTEYHTKSLLSARFYAVDVDQAIVRHRASWARALRDEATNRAEALDPVPVEVADALIASQALLDACERIQSST